MKQYAERALGEEQIGFKGRDGWTMFEKTWKREACNDEQHDWKNQEKRSLEKNNKGLIVSKLTEEKKEVEEEEVGFRQGRSTIDQLFTTKEIYLKRHRTQSECLH